MGHGFNKETLGLNMSQQWAWDAALNTMFMVTSSFDCLQYAKMKGGGLQLLQIKNSFFSVNSVIEVFLLAQICSILLMLFSISACLIFVAGMVFCQAWLYIYV